MKDVGDTSYIFGESNYLLCRTFSKLGENKKKPESKVKNLLKVKTIIVL